MPAATTPTTRSRRTGPSSDVIRAFGAREDRLELLPGGQGKTWSDGRLVLKPVGFMPEHSWVSEVYAGWTGHDDVRVPEPVRPRMPAEAGEHGWTSAGWGAHIFVPGRDVELPDEVDVIRSASDAFHSLVATLPRPGFMDVRSDPWAFGDRIAWEGADPEGDPPTLAVIARLKAVLAPVSSASQVIHGDILPNVLVAPGRAPAVIDWPPYFRPAALANAIAVTDVVTFRGAPVELLDQWARGDDWNQLLVRALLYRLGPTGYFAARNRLKGSLETHLERVQRVVDAVLDRFARP